MYQTIAAKNNWWGQVICWLTKSCLIMALRYVSRPANKNLKHQVIPVLRRQIPSSIFYKILAEHRLILLHRMGTCLILGEKDVNYSVPVPNFGSTHKLRLGTLATPVKKLDTRTFISLPIFCHQVTLRSLRYSRRYVLTKSTWFCIQWIGKFLVDLVKQMTASKIELIKAKWGAK